MDEIGRRAHNLSSDEFRAGLLEDVRRCCGDLQRASELTAGFESLLCTHFTVSPSSLNIGDRFSRGAKKLQWRFMKRDEAEYFTQRFRDWRLGMAIQITLLNECVHTSVSERSEEY